MMGSCQFEGRNFSRCLVRSPWIDYDDMMADWVEGDRMWTRLQGRWTELQRPEASQDDIASEGGSDDV